MHSLHNAILVTWVYCGHTCVSRDMLWVNCTCMLIVIFEWVLDLVDISFKKYLYITYSANIIYWPIGQRRRHINCYESIVLVFFFVIPVNKPVHKQVVYYISSVWTVYAIHVPWHVLRWVFCQIIAGYMKQSQSLRSL